MIAKRIQNWFTHFQKYFFTYRNGFFELSYLANSPKSMVESFLKMPFIHHHANEQFFSINNPFTEGELHYIELEEGLWLLMGKMEYKADVKFNMVYDKFIPVDYYMLSYNIYENRISDNRSMINDMVFPHKSWTFFKPSVTKLNYHFKNSYAFNFTIYFNESWLMSNLLEDKLFVKSELNQFIENKEKQYLVWPENNINEFGQITQLKKMLFAPCEKPGKLQQKLITLNIIKEFLEKYESEKIGENHFEISDSDQLRILKIEKYLYQNLEKKFEGIDPIAEKFNVSSSKLKNDFKLMFGKPVYQFFQEKQMQLARQLIFTSDIRIKELAWKFGYENMGKFSQAYKKYFNCLPSEEKKSA